MLRWGYAEGYDGATLKITMGLRFVEGYNGATQRATIGLRQGLRWRYAECYDGLRRGYDECYNRATLKAIVYLRQEK